MAEHSEDGVSGDEEVEVETEEVELNLGRSMWTRRRRSWGGSVGGPPWISLA